EAQDEGGIEAARRRGDRGHSRLSTPQKSARKYRGQAMLQVLFRADLGQLPGRELASEEPAEALAKHEPRSVAAGVPRIGTCHIDQEHGSHIAGEALDYQFQTAAPLLAQAHNTAGEVARIAPGLNGEARILAVDRVAALLQS